MKKAMLITIFVLSILIGMICVTNAENNQPEFLQNLFHEYFPDCSYEDGYLQYDETVIFIGRKPVPHCRKEPESEMRISPTR